MYANNQQHHSGSASGSNRNSNSSSGSGGGGYHLEAHGIPHSHHNFQSPASPPPLQHPIPTHPINLIRHGSPAGSTASTVHARTTSSGSSVPRRSMSSPLNQQYLSGGGGVNMGGGGVNMGAGGTTTGGPTSSGVSGYMSASHPPSTTRSGGGGGGMGWVPNQWGLNDATAQMGMQFGKSAVMAGHEYVEKNMNRWINIPALKHYFRVNNSYVAKKLQVIIFPWRHRPWSRLVKRSEQSGQMEGYKAPKEDINSPDMYIPVMAFVTYILLTGIVAGKEQRFHPEVLGVTASTAFAIIVSEYLMIKLGCYILNITSESQLLDLVAYSGYKFIGCILTLIARLFISPTYVWMIFFYTFFATAFFLLRSLKYVVLPESSNASTVTLGQRSKRIQFLFMVAMVQIVFMWILVR